ncbi:MAG TPA: exosortase system-associated protein, TIGR04073 family [Verrucomicrobiae bacterium]|jgi:putative exosortase-associated protein (TIGR04073 family)|nr:exosortase system-associated protein, TIGR04073 family [Verrucomicrobiae bacterium]
MRQKHFPWIALIVMALLVPARPAYCADMWSKLGRGINNVVFCWAEIFYRPDEMHENGEIWPIAVAGGIPKGLLYTVARAAVGVYEIVSFPFPGTHHYGVILEPEHMVGPNAY